jgi:23S rRNA pseudouridine1911/1915/1917 synthase
VRITVGEAGRVDKVVARELPAVGRRRLAELFDEGGVKIVRGERTRRARKGDRVEPGDIIELAHVPVTGDALRPAPDATAGEQLAVLLERPEIIVVAKPAGMPSQPLRAGELGTAASGIAVRWPECAAIGDDPRDGGLVHRLDIGTSGALIAARTPEAYRALRDAFGAGLVEKHYLAIVEGRPVSRDCDAPLAQHGRRAVVDHTDGLAAYTAFTVERATDRYALVHCLAQTGRTHQVRAHLAHVGAPIAGDTLYGGRALADLPGFFLHAAKISFPLAGTRIVVDAPIPPAFETALAAAGLTS